MSIAGSDSGGGAGVQADLKAFAAHGVHGTTALTAITAQSTAQVCGVVVLEPDFVRLQIETVLGDFDVRSVKTGMLATRAIVEVARAHAKGRIVSSLEGGYDLEALGRSAAAHVRALQEP